MPFLVLILNGFAPIEFQENFARVQCSWHMEITNQKLLENEKTAPWKTSFIVMFTSFMLCMLFFLFLFTYSRTHFVSWWFPLFGIFRCCFGNGKLLYRSSWSSIYFRYFFYFSSSFQVTSYWLFTVRIMFNVHGIGGKMFLNTKNQLFILFNMDFTLLQTYTSNLFSNSFAYLFWFSMPKNEK